MGDPVYCIYSRNLSAFQNCHCSFFLCFSSGGEIKEIHRLNGDFTEDDLRDFISSETGLYLQRPGCTRYI